MSCPKCDSARTKVRETRTLINGTQRRRVHCHDCGHRWTIWDGPNPTRQECAKNRRPAPKRKTRPNLTPDQVRRVLISSDLNNRQLADELGCSHETVRQIRNGKLYSKVHPELLRPKAEQRILTTDGPSCDKCSNWTDGRCSFGFPDPLLEGLLFATDCDLYEVIQSISRA
jgi:DNA-binding CsgD family transcriptional regulator